FQVRSFSAQIFLSSPRISAIFSTRYPCIQRNSPAMVPHTGSSAIREISACQQRFSICQTGGSLTSSEHFAVSMIFITLSALSIELPQILIARAENILRIKTFLDVLFPFQSSCRHYLRQITFANFADAMMMRKRTAGAQYFRACDIFQIQIN